MIERRRRPLDRRFVSCAMAASYTTNSSLESVNKFGIGAHSPPFQGGVAATKENIAKPRQRSGRGGFSKITNHPVCADKERGDFLEAQPPLLEKEGNALRFQFIHSPIDRAYSYEK